MQYSCHKGVSIIWGAYPMLSR